MSSRKGYRVRPGAVESNVLAEVPSHTRRMEPRVKVGQIPLTSTDGTFIIGRDAFPDFARLARLGVHIQSDRVHVAEPDPAYVQAALDALDEACRQLDIPEASIVFVDTVEPPPAIGLRYGFKGSYTTTTRRSSGYSRTGRVSTSSGRSFATRLPISHSHGLTRPRSQRATPDPRRTSRWHSSGIAERLWIGRDHAVLDGDAAEILDSRRSATRSRDGPVKWTE